MRIHRFVSLKLKFLIMAACAITTLGFIVARIAIEPTESAAAIVLESKTCTELGMVPDSNNTTDANGNRTKLLNAVNSNYEVLVDDLYYLGSSGGSTVNEDVPLISIKGITENAALYAINTILTFGGTTSLHVEGITFTSTRAPFMACTLHMQLFLDYLASLVVEPTI